MRLLLFSQNKFKRWRRRKSTSSSSSLVHQVRDTTREQRQSNRPASAAVVPAHVAENLCHSDDSENAGPVHVAAAGVPSEDAFLPQHDNLVIETASVITPTGEDESREALGVPTITITGPEEPESVESNNTTSSGRQVSVTPIRADRTSLRSSQWHVGHPQQPDARYIRRRLLGTPVASQSPGNSPPRRARGRTNPNLSPVDAERRNRLRRAFPEDAGVRPLFSLSTAATAIMGSPNHATRRTERPTEGSSGPRRRTPHPVAVQVGSSNLASIQTHRGMEFRRGAPAVLAIHDHEYLIRFENVIENARNVFPGMDSGDDGEIRLDPFGSVASGCHRTVAAGGDLWLIRIVTQLDGSGETTRLRTPPGSGTQIPDAPEENEGPQDDARHRNDSDSSGDAVHSVVRPARSDRSSDLFSTHANEAPAPSAADQDIQPVDPPPATNAHSHDAVNVETSSVEYYDLQAVDNALDGRDLTTPRQASPLRPVQRLARLEQAPPLIAAGPAPLQPDALANAPELQPQGSHANDKAMPSRSFSYPSIPTPPSPSDPVRESPRLLFAEVLTESPGMMTMRELEFAPVHARHLNASQDSPPSPMMEQTDSQASLANALGLTPPDSPLVFSGLGYQGITFTNPVETQRPPLAPPGLALGYPGITFSNPVEAQRPPLVPPGLALDYQGITFTNPVEAQRPPLVPPGLALDYQGNTFTYPVETQRPPLVPPGLALAMNRNPNQNAQNAPINQGPQRGGTGIAFPRLADPVISPAFASPFIQRPLGMGLPLHLTPAGYPQPMQIQHTPTNNPATMQGPQPPPQAADPVFSPLPQPTQPAFQRTIRRPRPATPPPTRPRPHPRSLPPLSESLRAAEFSPYAVDTVDEAQYQSGRISWVTKGKWKKQKDIFGLQAYPGLPVARAPWEVQERLRSALMDTVGCPPLPPRPHGGTLANAYGSPRIGITAREYFAIELSDDDEYDHDISDL
jgi:hypothetical protein